jgi:hypothetical protein
VPSKDPKTGNRLCCFEKGQGAEGSVNGFHDADDKGESLEEIFQVSLK